MWISGSSKSFRRLGPRSAPDFKSTCQFSVKSNLPWRSTYSTAKVGPSIDGPTLAVEYVDLQGKLLFTENWQVDLKSGALRGPNLRKLLDDPDIHIRQA